MKNKKVKYHKNAQYIDCALEGKNYCKVCGWTKKEIKNNKLKAIK